MLRGLVAPMEKHHQVRVLDEAIEAAVNFSHRYIPARQLPDKAVSLLDTACARVAISQHAKPAEVEDAEVAIAALETEKQSIARERDLGAANEERIAEIDAKIAERRERLDRARGGLDEGARAGRGNPRAARQDRQAGGAAAAAPRRRPRRLRPPKRRSRRASPPRPTARPCAPRSANSARSTRKSG